MPNIILAIATRLATNLRPALKPAGATTSPSRFLISNLPCRE
jgi:hypothetical protein